MAVQTTESDNAEVKKLDISKTYAEFSSGARTINDIADEHNIAAQQVVEAFDTYVQGGKKK